MHIVRNKDFFLCMQAHGCVSLLPREDWDAILAIHRGISNLNDRGFRKIQMCADQFDQVHSFLKRKGFYEISVDSDEIQKARDILGMSGFRVILDSVKSDSDLYTQYVNSRGPRPIRYRSLY